MFTTKINFNFFLAVKNLSKHSEFDLKSKPIKTSHLKSQQKSNVENGNNFAKYRTPSSLSTFESSHQSHQMHANMPMFNSTMDQLMNNIKHETARPNSKTEDIARKSKQHDNKCKHSEAFQNGAIPKKPSRNVPISFSNEPNRRDNLYSFFADPMKGPSINHLMDELSRNFSSFSDNESVKSSTSTLSKSLAENHIYEEILYECFEKQNQLDSVIDGQLNLVMLQNDHQTVSNGLNATSFVSNLATANNAVLDSTLGFSHKI